MKHKTVDLTCDGTLAAHLGEAITAYAHAAFPEGGSECAQVAREALLETSRQCAAHDGPVLQLRKRQLPQIRAAVKWYFSENAAEHAKDAESLFSLLDIQHQS